MQEKTILFNQLDELDWEELASLRKSNVFPRYLIKSFSIYKSMRTIREFIPIIGIIACNAIIIETIYNAIQKENVK